MATLTTFVMALAAFVMQSYPDLSGTWMVVGDRSVTTDATGRTVNMRVFGEMFVVKQSGHELRLILENGKGSELRYRVDGIEDLALSAGPDGQTHRTASRAVWEGPQLSITTWLADNPGAGRTTLVLTLLSDGTLRAEAKGPQRHSMLSVYGRIR
jgi:hypothetical protein